jgi:Holliday junction resolvase
MPNKNYVSGRALEYRIMKHLKERGYGLVVRSAGSHTLADIISFDTQVHLFQVKKREELHETEKSIELGRIARRCGAKAWEVWNEKGKLNFKEIDLPLKTITW